MSPLEKMDEKKGEISSKSFMVHSPGIIILHVQFAGRELENTDSLRWSVRVREGRYYHSRMRDKKIKEIDKSKQKGYSIIDRREMKAMQITFFNW